MLLFLSVSITSSSSISIASTAAGSEEGKARGACREEIEGNKGSGGSGDGEEFEGIEGTERIAGGAATEDNTRGAVIRF